jgi:hypothetical protein
LVLRRLASLRQPKHWGSVRDHLTGQPIQNAVARIFDNRFNKLLETQVTDMRGHYAFLVGASSYTVTFEKPGYIKQERTPLDLTQSAKDKGEFIAFDVKMDHAVTSTPTATPKQLPPELPPELPPSMPPAEPTASPVANPPVVEPPAPSSSPQIKASNTPWEVQMLEQLKKNQSGTPPGTKPEEPPQP